jgi:NADH-quinone oxidoreductase subunit L
VDAGIIDGTIVKGLGGGVGRLSALIRRLQTGYVRNYALGMLIGVVVLVISIIATWQKLALK